MKLDVRELEVIDSDIIESIRVAFVKIWKMKSVVIISAIIGMVLFFTYYSFVGNSVTYSSSATIFSGVYGSYEESYSGVSMMNTYSQLLGSYKVCDRAAEELEEYNISSEELQNMVKGGQIYLSGASTDSKSYSYALTLVAYDANRERVCDLTNAMAKAFADEINELIGNSTLQVLDEASNYSVNYAMNFKLYIVAAGIIGMILSGGIIFCVGFFSQKVNSIKQCESDENLILGILPYTEFDEQQGK